MTRDVSHSNWGLGFRIPNENEKDDGRLRMSALTRTWASARTFSR